LGNWLIMFDVFTSKNRQSITDIYLEPQSTPACHSHSAPMPVKTSRSVSLLRKFAELLRSKGRLSLSTKHPASNRKTRSDCHRSP
jgi:hypothetical protein